MPVELAIEGPALVDGAVRPAVVTVTGGRVAAVLPADTPVAAAERVTLTPFTYEWHERMLANDAAGRAELAERFE